MHLPQPILQPVMGTQTTGTHVAAAQAVALSTCDALREVSESAFTKLTQLGDTVRERHLQVEGAVGRAHFGARRPVCARCAAALPTRAS